MESPEFDITYNEETGRLLATQTLEAMLRDFDRTVAAARDEQIKNTLRGLGWLAPEDVAAHDAFTIEQADKRRRHVMLALWILASREPDGILITDAELLRAPLNVEIETTQHPWEHGTRIRAVHPQRPTETKET